MTTRRKGKCCAAELCKHKNLQLCKSHKCSGCKGIVHLLCATEDANTDERLCFKCSSSKVSSRHPKAAKTPKAPKEKDIKACKACGGTDHQRTSSHLCKANPKNASVPSNKKGGKHNSKKNEEKKNEEDDKNMRRPNFVHIKTKNEPAYKPVIDVSSHHFKPMGTEFKITRRNPTNL